MTRKANQPFVRNAWYIAAWAEELDNGLLARTIMNQPMVIYRDADGKVGALEDRCCHRGAPLTHGHVSEMGLQCGYHGLTFDTTGQMCRYSRPEKHSAAGTCSGIPDGRT